MSVDILGTSWDQCRSMVQYSFTSTETRRLVRTDIPGRPPRLSHSSWTMYRSVFCTAARHRPVAGRKHRTGEKWWGNSGPVTRASLHSSPATVTITKMLQVIAFSCRFWRKCSFAWKKGRNQKWKCWLWGVQETRCYEIYTTGHGKASPFQPWWSVRCAILTFDVNQCSLRG